MRNQLMLTIWHVLGIVATTLWIFVLYTRWSDTSALIVTGTLVLFSAVNVARLEILTK